jgi:RHS repeat-associated protein
VVATATAGGAVGARYRYDPYGKLQVALGETAATASELGFTNGLRLSGNLLHLKTRVYDAEGRVFLQADSVDRYRYAYVWGDPVNLSDPTGMQATTLYVNGFYWGTYGDEQGAVSFGGLKPVDGAPGGDGGGDAPPQAESANSNSGIGLTAELTPEQSKSLLEKFTNAAAESAQYWANLANKEKNPALKALYMVAGAMAGLGDKDAIGKTAATLASAGAASVVMRLSPVALGWAQRFGAWMATRGVGAGAAGGGVGAAGTEVVRQVQSRARFIADPAGTLRVWLYRGKEALEVSWHAAQRATQRGISLDAMEATLEKGMQFRYFHEGAWKTGYYDTASKVFVGTVNNVVTTVMRASPQYIQNLMNKTP